MYWAALFRQNLCKRDLGVKAVARGSAHVCPVGDSATDLLYDNEYLCKMGRVKLPYLERMLEKSV